MNAGGGLRWEKQLKASGAEFTGFFEGGVKGSYNYQFDTQKEDVDGGVYCRAVFEHKFPGKAKRRVQKSYNAEDVGW